MRRDTIAAIATASGPAAVGIVRISGPEAFAIGARLCQRWPDPLEPRRAWLTRFGGGERVIDSGLAIVFPGPGSFTGEDVLELQGHGGQAPAAVLAAAIALGARPAEPGEFTQRAFLNGKVDLVQAEAVAALIGAQTERALRAAQQSLGGDLSSRVQELEAGLLALRGRVEGLLDFATEAEGAEQGLTGELLELTADVRALARTFATGRRLFARSEVVLVGPVNAGKSSLLNALAGEERALVDAAPGTTRDLVAVDLELEGMPIRLVDTAGWREAEGVEARGIALGRAAANRASVALWVSPVGALEPAPEPGWLGVASKADLGPAPVGMLAVSARTGEGLAALRRSIAERLAPPTAEDELVVVGARQARALDEAAVALERAAGVGALELVAEELALAAVALGRVRGVGVEGEVMESVFRQFCIGK